MHLGEGEACGVRSTLVENVPELLTLLLISLIGNHIGLGDSATTALIGSYVIDLFNTANILLASYYIWTHDQRRLYLF